MEKIPLTRKYWLGELKRARLTKDDFIKKLLLERFPGLDPYDGDAKLSALILCEKEYTRFMRNFKTWIDDNYPAEVKEQDLFTNFEHVEIFNKAFGTHFNIVGL